MMPHPPDPLFGLWVIWWPLLLLQQALHILDDWRFRPVVPQTFAYGAFVVSTVTLMSVVSGYDAPWLVQHGVKTMAFARFLLTPIPSIIVGIVAELLTQLGNRFSAFLKRVETDRQKA